MKSIEVVLQRISDELPVSIRQLAREAGLAHVSLLARRDGQLTVGPEKLLQVAAALRGWGNDFARLADELEKAVRAEGEVSHE
jgi:hypothetical protein